MVNRGQFTINAPELPDLVFETLVGSLGELKASLSNIDTVNHQVDGKSRTTATRWGTRFHTRVVKVSFNVKVEIYDFSILPDERFIKELYMTFSGYMASSPLQVDHPKDFDLSADDEPRVEHPDEGYDNLASGLQGAPFVRTEVVEADEDPYKILTSDRLTCRNCGASNPRSNNFCGKCGSSFGNCPNCGFMLEGEESFCIKCGAPLPT